MAKAEEFKVVLTPGPEDPALESGAYQEELKKLGAALEPYKPRIPIRLEKIEAIVSLVGLCGLLLIELFGTHTGVSP